MTAAQRRASNRRNAQKSTGPQTPEGKERARQNALKHGLCADLLVLPFENASDLQDQLNEWIDHYQPVGPAEFALVEEIAVAQLKLRRCSRRETAVTDLQVRAASRDWVYAQEDRVAALTPLLATDPARAVRELRRFGAGRRWLLERWECLSYWFLRDGSCSVPALVDEAVRLLGADPKHLKAGPVLTFGFRVHCAVGRSQPDPKFIEWLLSDKVIHPEYYADHGRTHVEDVEFNRDEVRAMVREQIASLEQENAARSADEQAEAAGACLRAQIPDAGHGTSLALRYESQARTARDKAMKALERLQDERFAIEAEADAEPDVVTVADAPAPAAAVPSVARNEPDTPPAPPLSRPVERSYDGFTGPNGEPATECGEPTLAWLRAHPRVAPQERPADQPWDVPVVGPGRVNSPPA